MRNSEYAAVHLTLPGSWNEISISTVGCLQHQPPHESVNIFWGDEASEFVAEFKDFGDGFVPWNISIPLYLASSAPFENPIDFEVGREKNSIGNKPTPENIARTRNGLLRYLQETGTTEKYQNRVISNFARFILNLDQCPVSAAAPTS